MMFRDIQREVNNFIDDPYNPEISFNVGLKYYEYKQTAAAFSFFLRAAEYSTNDLLSYEALIRAAICLEEQGKGIRVHSIKGMYLRAISLIPKRPEAYHLLCQLYWEQRDYHECYANSKIGSLMVNNDKPKLRTEVGYVGDYVFPYYQMLAGWNIGLFEESIGLMLKLRKRNDIVKVYKDSIEENYKKWGFVTKKPTKYHNSYYKHLIYKFKDADKIDHNYSQCYQDMFVLTALDGKKEGRFLEIGCGDPYEHSNTALLEKQFNWDGISIDNNDLLIKEFKKHRNVKAVTSDALRIDYQDLLKHENYDYLQIDCEPADISYKVLRNIPFEDHKFAVITFEHDNYLNKNDDIKVKSREYLKSFGYQLVVSNISMDEWSDFEDWWVHPDLVDNNIINIMRDISESTKKVDYYMLNK